MNAHDDDLAAALHSLTPSPPARLPIRSAVTPQAAPRWLSRATPTETPFPVNAGEQPSATPRRLAGPPYADLDAAGCLRRRDFPVPGQRNLSPVNAGQYTRKNIFSLPGPMQAAMGDSTYVAVEATSRDLRRQSRAGPSVPARAKPPLKGSPKKELDIVIELPKNIGRSSRLLSGTKGSVREASMSTARSLPAARMPPAATETTVSVGEPSSATGAAAEGGSSVRSLRESSILRSISTTVGTIVSRLFPRGPGRQQAPSIGTVETGSTTRGRNPREIYVDIELRPRDFALPESTASVRPITASTGLQDNEGVTNAGEVTSRAPKVLSLTHVVTVKSPRKRSRKRMEVDYGKMKGPPEWAAAGG
ncbi:hypothetical protein HPB50_001138 [Hyalomma asiaticum]|uniref:Uncharacterized protein n=1 Tax=Hyalomma asiaticum TaxID=266040 RepID=A0ACB7SJD2_HYAAI|nr:hypothetical protein HPB50_001138 [Hyalomma asiaticum]